MSATKETLPAALVDSVSISRFIEVLDILDYDGDPWNVGSMKDAGGDPAEMLDLEHDASGETDLWRLKATRWSAERAEWICVRVEAEGGYKAVLLRMLALLPWLESLINEEDEEE